MTDDINWEDKERNKKLAALANPKVGLNYKSLGEPALLTDKSLVATAKKVGGKYYSFTSLRGLRLAAEKLWNDYIHGDLPKHIDIWKAMMALSQIKAILIDEHGGKKVTVTQNINKSSIPSATEIADKNPPEEAEKMLRELYPEIFEIVEGNLKKKKKLSQEALAEGK